MLFAIYAFDGPNGAAIRAKTRPAHLQYLKDAGSRIKLVGPITEGGEGGKPVGTLVVIDAASEAAVKLFAENDPYAHAGVFERVDIHPFKAVMGAWLPQE